jgi:hypothetical protein
MVDIDDVTKSQPDATKVDPYADLPDFPRRLLRTGKVR